MNALPEVYRKCAAYKLRLDRTLGLIIAKGMFMNSSSIMCKTSACGAPVEVSETGSISKFFNQMAHLYRTTTIAGDNAAQYWADIAVKSKHPLAPLAHVPGVFAALWTPEVAPTTAITLATAGYGFATLPKNLVHFTTAKGAQGISASATINSTKFGLFGPGVYMTSTGRPINLFVRAAAKTPIYLATPSGTARIIPYLVYVRWGLKPVVLP
ncbi:hypothetical protein [Cellvibrio sp. KY-GH-1]|uniref:hypothetical protein n=1 Tax=Cellvibrio sp. KY-GH-1 TaxID=2303332 RepID=UPI001CD9847B|nr:hypothetical protein [Cellvibrio sp. KY-GH-1]